MEKAILAEEILEGEDPSCMIKNKEKDIVNCEQYTFKKYKRKGFRWVFYSIVKRTFDLTLSILFLTLASPLFLGLALAIKISDGGRVFYKHPRVGRYGKTINIWKFRSMTRGADSIFSALSGDQMEVYLREFKVENDPRISKIGRFLRRTSFDELPQIVNVLVGEMSFIGPRPLLREELFLKYGEEKDKLVSVRPGITGYWQAYARNYATYESGERQAMEMYYVENCGLWFDTKIFFKTFTAPKEKGLE